MADSRDRGLIGPVELALIVLVCAVACLPLMRSGYFPNHEHFWPPMRVWGIRLAVEGGQFPPQILPNLVGGLGYGWHIFYPPLSYLFAYLFHAFGLALLPALKAAHLGTLVLSGLAMFAFVRRVTPNRNIALMAALLYVSAPYRLIDLYLRNAFAESFAFIWFPIVFLGVWEILRGRHERWWVLGAGVGALILTHLISAFYCVVFAALFVVAQVMVDASVRRKLPQIIMAIAKAALLTCLLAGFFLFPMIEHALFGAYAIFDPQIQPFLSTDPATVQRHSVDLWQLLELTLRLDNPYLGSVAIWETGEEMPFNIGVHLVVLALAALFLLRENRQVRILMFLAALTIVAMMAEFPWIYLPAIFSNIQFPWRLLMYTTFFLSVVGAFALGGDRLPERALRIAVIGGLIVMLGLDVQNVQQTRPVVTPELLSERLNENGTSNGEYFPASMFNARRTHTQRALDLAIIEGSGQVEMFRKEGTLVEFIARIDSPTAVVQLPLVYYLGYRASTTNGVRVPVSECPSGLACVTLSGSGKIDVRYKNTEIGKAGVLGTAFGLLWMGYAFLRGRRLATAAAGTDNENFSVAFPPPPPVPINWRVQPMLAAVVLMIGLGCAIFYPGFMSFDSAFQYWQIREGHFANLSPVAMTGFWALLNRLWTGPASIFLVHQVVFWGSLGWIMFHLFRHPAARIAAMLLAGASVPAFLVLGHIWTDASLIASLTGASALTLAGMVRRRRGLMLAALPLFFYAGAVRLNGLPALIPLAVLWSAFWLRLAPRPVLPLPWRKIAQMSLAIVLGSIATGKVLDALLVDERVSTLGFMVPWDLAGISVRSGENVIPDFIRGQNYVEEDVAAKYTPLTNVPLFEQNTLRNAGDQPLDLARAWWDGVSRHPGAYLEHRWALTEAVFGSFPEEFAQSLIFTPKIHYYRDNPYIKLSGIEDVRKVYVEIIEDLRGTFAIAPATYLVLQLFVLPFAFRWRRHPAGAMALAVGASGLLYVAPLPLVCPGAELRYTAWLCFTATFSLAVVLAAGFRKEDPA